nr:ABC transporter substrate-binding protein [Acidimicrobiales bacterium]
LDIAQLAMYVDIDGMEPEDAADAWLADHCDRWTGWSGADTSACPAAPEVAADSSDPIRIPIHNWSSQIAGVYIMGAILESAGNSVEYIPADSTLVYTSMCEGDMDLVHEVWESSFGPAFEEMVAKGCVVDATTHDTKTREEWWYPIHVEDHCPGLPDWEAMNDCAAIFATADSGGKGSYLAGPVDWMKADQERIDGLNLNWVVNNAGTAGALWAALDVAIANNEPIVMFNWTPNFVEALYEGKFIEFPEFEPDCNTDPGWGVNPDALYDCGNPKGGYLKIGVWEGFEAKWPNAFEVVQNINFANSDIAEMALYVDLDGMEPEDAADAWLADHCDRWTGWVGADESSCPEAPAPKSYALAEVTHIRQTCAPAIAALPMWVARDTGIFEELNLTTECVQIGSGPDVAAAMVAGEVEIATNIYNNMIPLIAKGLDIVGWYQQLEVNLFDVIVDADFVVPEGADWKEVMAALDGSSVGVVARGAAAEDLARELMRLAGLDPENQTYVAVGLDPLTGLVSDTTQWTVTFDPFMVIAGLQGIGYQPFALMDNEGPSSLHWPGLSQTSFRGYVEENPDVICAFTDGLNRASAMIADPAHFETVVDIALDNLPIDNRDLVTAIVTKYTDKFSLTGKPSRDIISTIGELSVAVGKAESVLTADDVVLEPDC